MIVEHVDEPGKAPRGVAHVRAQPGHPGDDYDGEAARELEVVELGARALAQGLEIEPHDAPGAPFRPHGACLDGQPRILLRARAHTLEAGRQGCLDRVGQRRVVALLVLELAQAVVGAAVDLEHVEPLP